MNNLYDLIQKTDLFDDLKLRKNILADVVPKSLQDLLGLDVVL